MTSLKVVIISTAILFGGHVYSQVPELLQATSKVIVDDGYDHAEMSVNQWGGSHGLFFGAKVNYSGSGHLWVPNNSIYAQDAGPYSYGAFSMGYIANGGLFSFYDGGLSTGTGNAITWNPVMSFVRGGNIGIGTTSPNEKLEVTGNIRQSGRTTYLFGANSNENQALMFAGWGVAHGGIYWRGDSRTFTINTGDNADNFGQYGNANLAVTGNVLIGKTSQSNTSYKLDINGNARANKIVVNTTGADFVFEEDYRLRKLGELQKYIRQNKHLPEIPSAKQMEAEGLDIGDMNIKLLQKVEELTLYLIDQNKKLEEQIRKNNDQQREIEALKKHVKQRQR